MAITKESREFFLRAAKVTVGSKADQEVGYPVAYSVLGETKFNRFLQGHFPSEGVMQKLFESLTFKLNAEDTSTLDAQGLSKIASDQNAYDRVNTDADSMATHIRPSQLPVVLNYAADTSLDVASAKETVGAGDCAVYRIRIPTATQTAIAANTTFRTQDVYLYLAGADDASGTGFTTTPATIASKDYIAILQTSTYKASPVVGDFTGLFWAKGGGGSSTFDMRFDVLSNIGSVTDEGDVFFATDTNAIYQVVSAAWVLKYTVPTAAAGTTYYTYVGYAEDNSGTGFSTSPDASRTYIAFKISTSVLTPVVGDFAGLWQKYLGDDGVSADSVVSMTKSLSIGSTGDADLVTYTELTTGGLPSPDGSNFMNFVIRVWRDDGSVYFDALDEASTPMTDLGITPANSAITANVGTTGDYTIKVAYIP